MPSPAIHPKATETLFAWDGEPLDEARFHARSCLSAVVGKQQNPSLNTEEKHDRVDDGSDADTNVPRDLVRTYGKAKLKETFLDKLAEVPSREKPQPGEKAKHIAAAAMVERDHKATIYVAKNGGLDEVDSSMLHVLLIWVRAIMANVAIEISPRMLRSRNQLSTIRSDWSSIGRDSHKVSSHTWQQLTPYISQKKGVPQTL